MKYFLAALLLAGAGGLEACDHSSAVNHQPITGDHPASPEPAADTITPDPAASRPVPFVNPTEAGLTPASPSPPESRTR